MLGRMAVWQLRPLWRCRHALRRDSGRATQCAVLSRFLIPNSFTPMFSDRRARSFLDPQAIARLAAVPLCARWPMLGSVSGRHPSPHRGASIEFAEYTESTSPATICGGWIGGPTGGPIAST